MSAILGFATALVYLALVGLPLSRLISSTESPDQSLWPAEVIPLGVCSVTLYLQAAFAVGYSVQEAVWPLLIASLVANFWLLRSWLFRRNGIAGVRLEIKWMFGAGLICLRSWLFQRNGIAGVRSEEHTSELQSL